MTFLSANLRGIIALTRWREHVPFSLPATLLGVALAVSHEDISIMTDTRWLAALAANTLAVTFAFMVNDLADAPDDARDPLRGARNPVASGHLQSGTGWAASVAVGLGALALYGLTPPEAFRAGALTLALGWFYSWRRVRLKAWPVVDVVSHALMLSALLVLVGYYACARVLGNAGWVALGAGLISAYGQLYNQLRDYDTDRAAGLRNTAAVLGRRATRGVMFGCLGSAMVVFGATMAAGLWPTWVIGLSAAVSPLLLIRRSSTDMRGDAALDLSGQVQLRFMLLATAVLIAWLVIG